MQWRRGPDSERLDLIANVVVLFASGALLMWYPKDSGFTVTTAEETHYMQGGVFLGVALICIFYVAIAAYLAWRTWRPR